MQLKAGSTVFLTLLGVIFTPLAQAHIVKPESMGLLSGVVHPLLGMDHILAAVAAGIWAAVSGGSHTRAIVAAFLGMLGLGAMAGLAGIPLAEVEPVIALSLIALGALIASRLGATRVSGPVVAGGFALFHGYAHTAGLPVTASTLSYCLGVLLMTLFLLLSGIVFGGRLVRAGCVPVGVAGGLVALIGSLLLTGT